MTLQAPETRTVEGVEIFAAGEWTDSQGNARSWTESDLDRLLKNFKDDSKNAPIPVKVGHTDDTFNSRVADELGVPKTLLTGDEGMGAARLGHIAEVRKDGDKILADFTGVPEPITDMIEAGMFNAVSVEIDLLADDDPHFSGVAILGAELPAVSTLAALDGAKIFSSNKKSQKWVTLSFQDGEPIQVDPEELAVEFAAISDKMEELIRGKKGARILRAFWSEVKKKMTDMTGKRFSKFDGKDTPTMSSWDAIVTKQMKDSTLKLPIELVAQICPDCAGEMGRKGLTALKIQNFELPDQLKTALMSMIGEPDETFFAKCMDFDLGAKTGDQLGFCAWLMKEYTGQWPNLEGGELQHSEGDGSLEFQPPQLVAWATSVSFDECVQQLSEPGKNISDPAALCASLKRAAGELQAFEEENNMGEFVLMPEDLPRLYEALGLPETATIEDVLAAIEAMKAGGDGEGDGGALPDDMVPMSEEDPRDAEIAELRTRLDALSGFNKKLEHERLVMTYAKKAASWSTISGTPEELGEELATLHETAGEKVASQVMASYQKAHDAAEESGAFRVIGSARRQEADDKPDAFEEKVEAYAKEHGISFNKALGVIALQDSEGFQEYKYKVEAYVNGG